MLTETVAEQDEQQERVLHGASQIDHTDTGLVPNQELAERLRTESDAAPLTRPSREEEGTEVPETSSSNRQNSQEAICRVGSVLLGRYRLEEPIGKGGMGRVYRATQISLERSVAIKILSKEFQQKDPQFVRRFYLEAASAARLTHPNTITVFDYGEAETGELFIVMEHLKGRSLGRVLAAEGAFAAGRVAQIGMQICRALREAHAKGIIHRDLKPGNIHLLDESNDGEDFVKVLDFGLVKLYSANGIVATELDVDGNELSREDVTDAGMFLGSPKYMSPEQIQGKDLDPRTDIYGLGVLLFQMAANRPPFVGNGSMDVIYRQINQPVPMFASLGVTVPGPLESVIRRCLAKRREERFTSMNELLIALKGAYSEITGRTLSDLGISTENTGDITTMYASNLMGSVSTASRTDSLDVTTSSGAHNNAGSKSSSFLPVVFSFAIALIGGALVSVTYLAISDPDPISVARFQPVELQLTSSPDGAEVFHNGVSLGKTPLTTHVAAEPEGVRTEYFTFKAKGYDDKIVEAKIGRNSTQIRVALEEEKYLKNPYD